MPAHKVKSNFPDLYAQFVKSKRRYSSGKEHTAFALGQYLNSINPALVGHSLIIHWR